MDFPSGMVPETFCMVSSTIGMVPKLIHLVWCDVSHALCGVPLWQWQLLLSILGTGRVDVRTLLVALRTCTSLAMASWRPAGGHQLCR